MRTLIRTASLALFVALVIAAAGCSRRPRGDYSSLHLARVSGTITLDGEPLSGARVVYEVPDSQPVRQCSGRTDDNGYYKITFDGYQDGVHPGPHIVRIYGGRFAEGEGASAGRVPAKYNRESELSVTCEPDSRHTFDFDLTTS